MGHTEHIQTGEIAKPNTAAIWRVFWILLGITALEFIVALAIPDSFISHGWKVVLYIIMTIFKAAYIIGEFMHLGHEVRFLLYSIILPMAFIVWLLGAMIWESGSVYDSHDKMKKKEKPKTTVIIQIRTQQA